MVRRKRKNRVKFQKGEKGREKKREKGVLESEKNKIAGLQDIYFRIR